MQSLTSNWPPQLQNRISEVIKFFSAEAARYPLDNVQLEYLEQLSCKGKQFRGCLLLDFYQLLSEAEFKQAAMDVAAAVELYGTALLIHDDIMDRSERRRSLPAAHKFLSARAAEESVSNPDHFGISAAICLGDVLFFLADRLIAQANLPAELRLKMAAVCSTELALLGLAQVEDVRLSSSSQQSDRQTILRMYAGKTGRYTGRWPLHLACLLAGKDDDIANKVAEVGEKIGVLYQLKDDELGLFGEEANTGKSASSDITEGKKTLYYYYLLQIPESADKSRIFSILGNSTAQLVDIKYVKSMVEQTGIRVTVEQEISALKASIETAIDVLPVPAPAQHYLHSIVEFVVSRNS